VNEEKLEKLIWLKNKYPDYEVMFVTDMETVDEERWDVDVPLYIQSVTVDARYLTECYGKDTWSYKSDCTSEEEVWEFLIYAFDPSKQQEYSKMTYAELLDEYEKVPWQNIILVRLVAN
jgi:hypothetical protein